MFNDKKGSKMEFQERTKNMGKKVIKAVPNNNIAFSIRPSPSVGSSLETTNPISKTSSVQKIGTMEMFSKPPKKPYGLDISNNIYKYVDTLLKQRPDISVKLEDLKSEFEKQIQVSNVNNNSKTMVSKKEFDNLNIKMQDLISQKHNHLLNIVNSELNTVASKEDVKLVENNAKEWSAKQDLEILEILKKKNNEEVSMNMDNIQSLKNLEEKSKNMISREEFNKLLETSKKEFEQLSGKTNDMTSKKELDKLTEKMKYFALKTDVEIMATSTRNLVSKHDFDRLGTDLKELMAKQDLDVLNAFNKKTKEFVTKKELENQKTDILRIVDEKFQALDMKDLTNKYVKNFEEIIEPTVARIIYRTLQNSGDSSPDDHIKQEDVHFDKVYEDESDSLMSIENPIQSPKPVLVEMGKVYHEQSPTMYQNELRNSKLKTDKWSKLGDGIEKGNVIDILMDKTNKKIYIAGHFGNVSGQPIENIAVYDLQEKSWKHVGEGVPHVASSLAIDEANEIVYVSGIFTKVGKGNDEVKANNIAAFDVKQNKWFSLGEGLNRDCMSILYDSSVSKIYASGAFTCSGNTDVRYIGVYDIQTKIWSELKGGTVNKMCRVLLKNDETNELYAGGIFTRTIDNKVGLSYLGKYNLNDEKWYPISLALQAQCNTMALDKENNYLYIGGTFKEPTQNINHVVQYNLKTNTWDNMDGGVNNVVQSLHYENKSNCLYAGGSFSNTLDNSTVLNYIAKYIPNERKWQSLESYFQNSNINVEEKENHQGLDGVCKVVSADEKSLFIAGNFKTAGNISANSIARYALVREPTVP